MKKIIIVILGLSLFLTGCNNNKKEQIEDPQYNLYNSYFKVAEPYKNAVAGSYITSYMSNRYDITEVEDGLMRIVSKYYSNNNYLYQSGQYITKDELKSLLSEENLNKHGARHITYVLEQNYLTRSGDLEAVALAIVLNPHQQTTVDDAKLKEIGSEAASQLIAFLRSKDDLKDKHIIIALYSETKVNSIVPGNFKYEMRTKDELRNFVDINEQYYLFPSNELATKDQEVYNHFREMEKELKTYEPMLSISGLGLYSNDVLSNLTINITTNYINQNQIIAIAQSISQNIVTRFDAKIAMQATIKNDTEVKGIVTKSNNDDNPQIYLIN